MIGTTRFCSSASQLAKAASSTAAKLQARRIHLARALPYDVAQGMGEFLSPKGLQVVAVDYQNGLLERLNETVKETELENQSVVQTVISTAGDRSKVLAFNYATEALNNSFFLDHLKPPSSQESDHLGHEEALYSERQLLSKIESSFGSLTQLKSSLSAAAVGMSGSGWVWLAANQHAQLAVVPTFGPGTILARSGQPMAVSGQYIAAGEGVKSSEAPQEPEAPVISRFGLNNNPGHWPPSSTTSSPRSGVSASRSEAAHPSNPQSPPSRSLSTTSFLSQTYGETKNYLKHNPFRMPSLSSVNQNHVTNDIYPLLCVSVHEHAWMTDYGVWGKEEYLKRFWSSVDWQKVTQSYNDWSRVISKVKRN